MATKRSIKFLYSILMHRPTRSFLVRTFELFSLAFPSRYIDTNELLEDKSACKENQLPIFGNLVINAI